MARRHLSQEIWGLLLAGDWPSVDSFIYSPCLQNKEKQKVGVGEGSPDNPSALVFRDFLKPCHTAQIRWYREGRAKSGNNLWLLQLPSHLRVTGRRHFCLTEQLRRPWSAQTCALYILLVTWKDMLDIFQKLNFQAN